MVAAGEIAVQLEMWTAGEAQRQNKLIEKAGLPSKLPQGLDIEGIIDTLQTDKKVKDGQVRFVLPSKIGEVIITDRVSADAIREVLGKM